jgi:filamentous hemagglutinin
VDDVKLNTVYNANGPIRVMAGGTIRAVQVLSATDAPGHNIGLMSTGGDLEVGFVRAGVVNGQISLSADGTIRELAGVDAAVDVIGNMAVIYAGAAIATGDAALELGSSVEVHSFEVADIIFETDNDVELFLFTSDNRVHVKTREGDMIISRLLSNRDEIKLEAPNGIMDIGYLDAGEIEGFIDLDAGGEITLAEATYDGQTGEIISYEDILMDSNSAINLYGDMSSSTAQIDVDAGDTLNIYGVLTAQDLILFANKSITIGPAARFTSLGKMQIYSQNDGGNVIIRGTLTSGSELQIKAGDDLRVEASAKLSAGLSSRLDSERGRLIINGSLEANSTITLLSELETEINGPVSGVGYVDIYTDNGNLIVVDTVSSDAFVNIVVEGDRLEIAGTINAVDGVYINSRLNNHTEISGEIAVSSDLGVVEVIMRSEYVNGLTIEKKLIVSGRIVAAESIYLETYGALELPVGSYLTGTGNDASAEVELVSATDVSMTGRVNATSFIVRESGAIVTSAYSDRILNYTGDALTLGSEGLILDNNLVIKVDGDIDLSDVDLSGLPFGGRIEIQASGTITVTSLVAGSGIVSLESTGGDVIVHSLDASSSSGVSLKAAGSIRVTSSVADPELTELNASGTSLTLEAQSILINGDVTAGSNITLNAEVNLTVDGTLVAGGDILLNAYSLTTTSAGENLQINGAVTAGGILTLNANSESILITGTITADSDITLTAGGLISVTGIVRSTASVVALMAANGNLLLNGTLIAEQSITLTTGAALKINGVVTSNTASVIMDVATTLDISVDGKVSAANEIVADSCGAITIEGTLQAQTLIDLYTEAELTLGAAASLSTSDGVTGFIRLNAYKVLEEAADSTVNAVTELRITESIANLEWDIHGSTTWMHVEDNDSLLLLLLDGQSVLLVSDTALLGEPAGAAYSLGDPSGVGDATGVFLYSLTIEVVTDLVTGELTIHYTAEQLTSSVLTAVEPVSVFDNIVSVSSNRSLNHIDGLLGIEMNLVEIDTTGDTNYQQAIYSLLTRNS